MHVELMAIEMVLRRWLEMPDAPICETSPTYGEKRNRPYTPDEIRKMRDFSEATCMVDVHQPFLQ